MCLKEQMGAFRALGNPQPLRAYSHILPALMLPDCFYLVDEIL